ncbi:ferrous iron transport protein B [Gemmatimonadetes bacterium T265]|nr:ferrous iron transport protein B [Gemmatimonadetes bacterium T265]
MTPPAPTAAGVGAAPHLRPPLAGAAPPSAPPRNGVLRVALVGNPNTGKTTLFNALTGLRQKVGNFAGVTVERTEGHYRTDDGGRVSVLDLPGSYSLSAGSPDERIALEVLLGRGRDVPVPDVVVVVADAQHLERNLFLLSQVLELGLPVVVALNQVDAAMAAGVTVDVPELIHELGATAIPTVAKRGEGLEQLKRAIARAPGLPRASRPFLLPEPVAAALAPVEACLRSAGFAADPAGMEALRLLGVAVPESHVAGVPGLADALDRARAALRAAGLAPERVEAEIRYGWIGGVLARAVHRAPRRGRTATDRLDAVALHRVWGWLVFVVLMALVFQSVFSVGLPIGNAMQTAVGWIGTTVSGWMPPGDLRSLVVDGVIAGVGSVIVFLPQIAMLFLFIGVLEDTGYMARAAFLMDGVMRRVGLHGKSFIPMLSGYACAVPGIMATRTVEHEKDRLATIMVVPLMSCSARLPVYTLLIGAFVPALPLLGGLLTLQGAAMLVMYVLGTATALGAAALFKRTLLRGPARPMILELPPYRRPSVRSLAISVTGRAKLFLKRAGTVILALSVVLWAAATYPKSPVDPRLPEPAQKEAQLEHSALGRLGRAIEPAVRPLGYDWKIGVSIAASFAAREVFVSTMGTIYGVGEDDGSGKADAALRDRLRADRDARTGRATYTPLVAIGLMVFYVYALMCMSTVAVTVRETGGGAAGWRWAAVQFGYMLALAYVAALVVYQGGRLLGLG